MYTQHEEQRRRLLAVIGDRVSGTDFHAISPESPL
jgi:hypothetical protein